MRTRLFLLAVALAALLAVGRAVSPSTVFDFGTNDTTGLFNYVGVLLSPDVDASCNAAVFPYAYWACNAIQIDAAALGFPASYNNRLVLTSEFCMNISQPVAGKGRLVSFDYNPNANGAYTYAGALNCPTRPYRVVDVDTSLATFYEASVVAYIKDDYKFPTGIANGVQGSGDLALLLLDAAHAVPSAVIATGYEGKLAPAAFYTAAHQATYSAKGSTVQVDSPQRKYSYLATQSSTATMIKVSQNPNKDYISQSTAAAPAMVSATTRNVIGLLNAGSGNSNSNVGYARLDTPAARAFLAAVAAYASGTPIAAASVVEAADVSAAFTDAETALLVSIRTAVWVVGSVLMALALVGTASLVYMACRKAPKYRPVSVL